MVRLLYLPFFLFFLACKNDVVSSPKDNTYKKISGITMGVIRYNISYEGSQHRFLKFSIDSLLNDLNMGSSTYEKESTITKFNESQEGITIKNSGFARHFIKNVLVAKNIVEKTDGYFDPTVAPLVNYYGFGNKGKDGIKTIDSTEILEILNSVGFNKIIIKKEKTQYIINKTNPDTQLDFSAIAKGYAIDEVGAFLEEKNINNYLIEIGGEIRARGKNNKGKWWKIAIKKPTPKASKGYYMDTPLLKNRSMATSGNYENYRIVDGKKIGHTINPKTGFPEINPLLSATVFANDCIMADSYATAFMAMGIEKAFNLAEKLPKIEAYFVYFNANGKIVIKYTNGLEDLFNKPTNQ